MSEEKGLVEANWFDCASLMEKVKRENQYAAFKARLQREARELREEGKFYDPIKKAVYGEGVVEKEAVDQILTFEQAWAKVGYPWSVNDYPAIKRGWDLYKKFGDKI